MIDAIRPADPKVSPVVSRDSAYTTAIAEGTGMPEQGALEDSGQKKPESNWAKPAPASLVRTAPLRSEPQAVNQNPAPPPNNVQFASTAKAKAQERPSSTMEWKSDEWSGARQVPMMVGPDQRTGRRRLWALLALFLLAAGGAAAYLNPDRIKGLFGARQQKPASVVVANLSTPESGSSIPRNSAGPGVKGDPATSPVQGKAPAASNTDQDDQGQPAQLQAQRPVSPPTGDKAAGQNVLSLQAASFPNEAAAKGFSEKLNRAGVPAYVVAADIPRRGRWFRVRAGKFGSSEEARKYAAEWYQRARAAGINIQLVTCEYD